MADTKISALTSGNPAQSGDEIPIARSGANYKITAGSIASLAAPAGSTTQLQYNNAGAFGGADLWQSTNTVEQRNATNAQTLRVYNTYTSSTNYERAKIAWDTNVLKIGTEKGSGGGTARALELQTDGTTALTIASDRIVTLNGNTLTSASALNIYSAAGNSVYIGVGSTFGGIVRIDDALFGGMQGLRIKNTSQFGWSSDSTSYGAADLILYRDAANTLAQRNAANAQTFRIYNTYTDANNYERAKIAWDTNVLKIGTEKGSGGGTARALELQTDGTTRLTIASGGGVTVQAGFSLTCEYLYGPSTRLVLGNNANQLVTIGGFTSSFPAIKRSSATLQARLADDSDYAIVDCAQIGTTKAYTVATLPAAGTAGRRAYVTDATTPTFLGTLTGGGSVVCPVFDNGTAWVAG